MKEFLLELLQAAATALVPVCAGFLILFLRRKSAQIGAQTDSLIDKKLLAEVTDAVTTAVAYTSQTYVDALKSKGEFTVKAQREAAQKALTACLASLSPAAQAFIESAYGDLTKYLTTKIEAEVRAQKLSIGLPITAVQESTTDAASVAASTAAATAATIAQAAVQQLKSEPTVTYAPNIDVQKNDE